MEMDEMELDRYVTDMLDFERDVHVKRKTKQEQNGRGDKDEKRQDN